MPPVIVGVPKEIFYKIPYELRFYDWFILYIINKFVCDERGGQMMVIRG
jgi:hypothetical protein